MAGLNRQGVRLKWPGSAKLIARAHWEPIGNPLGTHWEPIGKLLGSYWEAIGKPLALSIHCQDTVDELPMHHPLWMHCQRTVNALPMHCQCSTVNAALSMHCRRNANTPTMYCQCTVNAVLH